MQSSGWEPQCMEWNEHGSGFEMAPGSKTMQMFFVIFFGVAAAAAAAAAVAIVLILKQNHPDTQNNTIPCIIQIYFIVPFYAF